MTAPISSSQPNVAVLASNLEGYAHKCVHIDSPEKIGDLLAAASTLRSHASLKARNEELEAVLRGNDPEMPDPITPLGWLKTMIDECRRIGPELPEDADPGSWYEMINEVQELHDRARTLIQSKGEK